MSWEGGIHPTPAIKASSFTLELPSNQALQRIRLSQDALYPHHRHHRFSHSLLMALHEICELGFATVPFAHGGAVGPASG